MHFNPSSNIVRRLESLRNASLCRIPYVSCRNKSYYSVLEINPDADSKDIKDSFYNLSKKHHPDLNKDDDASIEKFREILEAYETLINPELRKLYDQKYGIGVSPGRER